jgi:hypothetical protein
VAAALALASLEGAQAAGRDEESMVFGGKQGDFSDLRTIIFFILFVMASSSGTRNKACYPAP